MSGQNVAGRSSLFSLASVFGESGWSVLGENSPWVLGVNGMEMGANASRWHHLFFSFESRPRDAEQTGDIFDCVIVHCLSSP